jgi:hypothetical protein
MFYFPHLHLEMLISLAKCLFKFGYEVHVFSWIVPKCSVTLAEASTRCKAVVAKPTTALLTLGANSRPALLGICTQSAVFSGWIRRNMQETAVGSSAMYGMQNLHGKASNTPMVE